MEVKNIFAIENKHLLDGIGCKIETLKNNHNQHYSVVRLVLNVFTQLLLSGF
jgi:hypothetical protein